MVVYKCYKASFVSSNGSEKYTDLYDSDLGIILSLRTTQDFTVILTLTYY